MGGIALTNIAVDFPRPLRDEDDFYPLTSPALRDEGPVSRERT